MDKVNRSVPPLSGQLSDPASRTDSKPPFRGAVRCPAEVEARSKTSESQNAERSNPDVCHSHDYCDANMIMHAAGIRACGWAEDWDLDEVSILWNDAWELAQAGGFQRALDDGADSWLK